MAWVPSYEASKSADFTKAYLKSISALAAKAGAFVCATDYDIEGEVIAANILEFACKAKSASRMKFSTLTKEELLESFEYAAPSLDKNLAEAGRTRHKLDFFWGVSLSRALMAAIKSAGRFQVLSVGRVQGPALAIIARRQKEIEAFKPVAYWQVFALAKGVQFTHLTDRFDSEKGAADAVSLSGKQGVVESVTRAKYHQLPPFPFDLTTLQTEAYRTFGFTPTQTLDIAQQLYEQAYISYPRTSSQKLSQKLGLSSIIRSLSVIPAYSVLAKALLGLPALVPHEGKQEDPAHPAIYPTGQVPRALNAQQQKLYDLVVRRFLACFASPAVREKMSVGLDFAGQRFGASGSRTLAANWLEFYSPYVKLEEVLMPPFAEKESVGAEKVWSERKETQPPKHYTAASIVRKLEEESLGTKATRAGIVQTLFDRGYVEGKSLAATPLGLNVFAALSDNAPHILEEDLTRHFEQEIDAISSGTKDPAEVTEEAKRTLVQLLAEFSANQQAIGRRLLESFNQTQKLKSVLGPCKTCGKGSLLVRTSRYGVFVGCSNYPACRQTYPLPKECSAKATGKVCTQCGTPIVTVLRKGKRPWRMCLSPGCPSKSQWGKAGPQAGPDEAEAKPQDADESSGETPIDGQR